MAPFGPLPLARAWEEAAVAERFAGCLHPPQLPLGLGPPRTEESARIHTHRWYAVPLAEEQSLRQLDVVGAKSSRAAPGEERPSHCFSPVLCVFFYERAYEPARLSRAFSRRASGKRTGA